MSERTRQIRRSSVGEAVALLPIEPLLVRPDEEPVAVMHRVARQPQTRLLGVVDDVGVLIGVLSILRLAEAVIIRVSPETILADADLGHAAEFGHAASARSVADVMLPPAVIRLEDTLDTAFRRMHARHLSGLYVVDGDGRPTGYLDILELTMRYVAALEADLADAG